MTVTTDFKISYKKNQNIYMDGYVKRYDKDGEDVEYFYYDNNNNIANRIFIHDDTDIESQNDNDIENFRIKYTQECEWIGDIILQTDLEDVLNETYKVEWKDFIIEVEDVVTDCMFDAHDFLCNSCDKCGECGFENDSYFNGDDDE